MGIPERGPIGRLPALLISARAVHWLRLGSGLVMFSFLLTHFSSHVVGLYGLETANRLQPIIMGPWWHGPGAALLRGAALLHLALAFHALYRRRHLRMPLWEAAQLGLGLLIPVLLIGHFVQMQLAFEYFGTATDYSYAMLKVFSSPMALLQQFLLVKIAWVHACIGLHFWLRLKDFYRRSWRIWFGAALLIPALAEAGAIAARSEAMKLAEDPLWLAAVEQRLHLPDAAGLAQLEALRNAGLAIYLGLLLLVVAARAGRYLLTLRRLITVSYPGGRRVRSRLGPTLLEISRGAGVPHASVCGGRGRCSTCRVRVLAGTGTLPPPGAAETHVLGRLSGYHPGQSDIRLACQIRPQHDLTVVPLLPPSTGLRDIGRRNSIQSMGEEREIVAMFADLRGFTTIAEGRLPYDIVFLLNRFAFEMGSAIESNGGRLVQFMGDGVFALFGLQEDLPAAARHALAAAADMLRRIELLNTELGHSLDHPLRIGIGLHAGAVVVGEMGYGSATYLTAIGDVVNTASRLETLTKDHGCLVVLSMAVAAAAGLPAERLPWQSIAVRGKSEPIDIGLVTQADQMRAN